MADLNETAVIENESRYSTAQTTVSFDLVAAIDLSTTDDGFASGAPEDEPEIFSGAQDSEDFEAAADEESLLNNAIRNINRPETIVNRNGN